MANRTNERSWLIPVATVVVTALGICGLISIAGLYFFYGPGSVETRPQIPVAIYLTSTKTATILPTMPLIVTNTPATLSTVTRIAAPSATRPAATATPGAVSGKIAFSIDRGERPEDKFIWLMNADGGGAKQILDRASSPAFSPDGSLIAYYHWTDGIYIANAADGSNQRKIVGETNAKYLSWSHDGKWIAFRSQPAVNGNVYVDAVLIDGTGRRNIAVGDSPSWSFDDRMIALQTCKATACGIHRVSSEGGDPIPITNDAGGNPAWSPDGKKILYQLEAGDVKQLFVVNVDGTGKKQLTSGASLHVDGQWSSDGNYIFYRSTESGSWAIWRMNADGSRPVKLIEDTPPVDWPYEKLAVLTLTK